MSEQSLKDKTVKGVAWSGIGSVANYAVSFIVGIILARLLSPDDYGLIGLTGILTAVCGALVNGGFSSALIRKKDATEDDYNTMFNVNLVMSLLLYGVIFVCAPAIARFFERNELVLLTRVSSLGLIIGAFSMAQQVRLSRRIDFKTQTRITVIASSLSGVTGIVLAFIGCGVWALVVQSLLSQFLITALLMVFNKWVPKRCFSMQSFRDLFGFGWKMMVSGIIDTVWSELNQVVIGKFYSPASLGQYTRAHSFAGLFSSNITAVVQKVSYPVLSSIQDDKTRLVLAYRRIIKTTMFVTTVGLFSLGAISEPLIYCLIGSQWREASTYLPLICISMSLFPLHAINLNMLKVQGRSDLFLILEILKKSVSLAPLLIGAFVGIKPMLYTGIFTGVICYFLNSHWSGKFLGYSSWMQVKDVASSYCVAFAVAVSVWFLKYIPVSYWIILPMQVVIGAVVFFVLCRITQIEEYREIKGMLMPVLERFKRK